MPVEDTDLTILVSNIMENAIEGADIYRKKTGRNAEISIVAGIVKNYLALQVSNPCESVLYAPGVAEHEKGGYLGAERFLSIHENGGYGLKRISVIAGKYGGMAEFMFDEKKEVWTSRISIPLSK